MWTKAIFCDAVVTVWQCPDDLINVVWKVGELKPGQIWAQFAEDAPYRPMTPVRF